MRVLRYSVDFNMSATRSVELSREAEAVLSTTGNLWRHADSNFGSVMARNEVVPDSAL